MSLERVRTQTRCWDPNVLMSERTYVRENSCLMLKQIKSITSKDVDSDEIRQRKYIGNRFFERICPSRSGAIMRYKHLSEYSVPAWINPYVIKIQLICSRIIHYFKMKKTYQYFHSHKSWVTWNIYINQKFSTFQFNMRDVANLIHGQNKILKYSKQKC